MRRARTWPHVAAFVGLALALCWSGSADASEPWAVLPVRSDNPPTNDPTLLRLTKSLGEALHEQLKEPVRVVSRDLRDEACPSFDAVCPNDVASLVNAERVISLLLSEDHKILSMRVYHRGGGQESSFELPCQWTPSRVDCDTKQVGAKIRKKAPAIAREAVEALFAELAGELDRCTGAGIGKHRGKLPKEVKVSFRLDGRGRSKEVRIEPRKVQNLPAYACMARTVESIRLQGHGGDQLGLFRFPLPEVSTTSK